MARLAGPEVRKRLICMAAFEQSALRPHTFRHLTTLLMNSQPLPTLSVVSPCTKVCTLDPRGICVGCGRELSEIANWSRMSAAEQSEVCRRARERREQRGS